MRGEGKRPTRLPLSPGRQQVVDPLPIGLADKMAQDLATMVFKLQLMPLAQMVLHPFHLQMSQK